MKKELLAAALALGLFAVPKPAQANDRWDTDKISIFDETIDVYVNKVSTDKIDPNALPRYIDPQGHCSPFYPHSAVRTNTLFEVIKGEHAGRTAWADKHPAYDLVNGPSGVGVDDLYTPEITNAPGFDNTISVVCTVQNDGLKVRAILNEIPGLTHDGSKHVGVPTVFGMNFQAVSVGQKLLKDNADGSCTIDTDPSINGQRGGYIDGSGLRFEKDRRRSLAIYQRLEERRHLQPDLDHRHLQARPIAHQSS
jgi:hypothetical protein